jgi:hypothetical protein
VCTGPEFTWALSLSLTLVRKVVSYIRGSGQSTTQLHCPELLVGAHNMAGPHLELFKFAFYLFFPIGEWMPLCPCTAKRFPHFFRCPGALRQPRLVLPSRHSGAHIHVELWSPEGRNLHTLSFSTARECYHPTSASRRRERFYIAVRSSELVVLLCRRCPPTIAPYKRNWHA